MPVQDWIEAERRALSALCQGKVSDETKRTLAGYRWREPLHQAVFGALAGIPSNDLEVIRGELPARLTRQGFPDVDLNGFFEPCNLARGEIELLVRHLQDSQRY